MDDDEDFIGSPKPKEGAAAAELRQFIERVERIELDMTALQDDRKEVYAEAKARGYDVQVMKLIVRIRKKDPDDLAEQEAVEEMYRNALGI